MPPAITADPAAAVAVGDRSNGHDFSSDPTGVDGDGFDRHHQCRNSETIVFQTISLMDPV